MRPDWRGAERVATAMERKRNPGKPFYDELMFARRMIVFRDAAVQKKYKNLLTL